MIVKARTALTSAEVPGTFFRMNPSPPFDEWFVNHHGMPQPLWWHVSAWERSEVADGDRETWLRDFIREWLRRLASALGPHYVVDESENFHLLSTLSGAPRSDALKFLERARKTILGVLGERIAPRGTVGKHLVLRFRTEEEYLCYVAHWLPDRESAATSGMCIYGDYVHIASFEPQVFGVINHILVHELAHNLTFHLPQPTWLREGLAMFFESDISGGNVRGLDRDFVEEHRAFWNPETIQRFWKGESFSSVDGQHLSYSLADTLFRLIRSEVRPAMDASQRFVLAAAWNDAGDSAARNYLGVGLDEVVALFLGQGDWRPKPETWRTAIKPEPPPAAAGIPDENGFIWPEGLEPESEGK